MIYYITYSCGCGDNTEVIETESIKLAMDYARECAIDEYQSFEGYHGVRDWDEIRDECDSDDEADELYQIEVEETIVYYAVHFDGNIEDHVLAYNKGVRKI